MVGTPVSWLVDIMSAGVHKAGKSAHLSSGTPFPSMEGQQAPSPFGSALMRAHYSPTNTTSVALMEKEVMMQEAPSSHGSL